MRTRITYANVAATLALVFSMSGGALAASHYMINSTTQINPKVLKKLRADPGAQGPTGTVGPQGQEGVRGSTGSDGARGPTGSDGARGPTGSEGAKGSAGPTGPTGPSEGWTAKVLGNFEIGQSEEQAVLVTSLKLPAGKWMVSAETGLTNISGEARSAWCKLSSGSTEIGRTRALDVAAASQRSGSATVLGGVDLPSGGTVEFLCWAQATLVYVPANSDPAIDAIQVATLNGK
jgi:hypothetical protein